MYPSGLTVPPARRGGNARRRSGVASISRRAQRIAGIEQGVHILRHTFCSAFALPRYGGQVAFITSAQKLPATIRRTATLHQSSRSERAKRVSHAERSGDRRGPRERPCKGSGGEAPRPRLDSGLRGSNPSNWLGKPGHYHYAKPARRDDRSTAQGSRLKAQAKSLDHATVAQCSCLSLEP